MADHGGHGRRAMVQARLTFNSAVGPFRIDLFLFNEPQCKQGRNEESCCDEENCSIFDEVSAGAHRGCTGSGAQRGEARISAEPLAHTIMADEAEADRSDRRTQDAAGERLYHRGHLNDRGNRP